jgi:transposase
MKKAGKELQPGDRVFVGIDLHKNKWHVTARTSELELFSGSIPGSWEALQRILDRYKGHGIETVYEAGYFGFWLYDELIEYGAECIVTPPSLIPQEYGNKVKTDRRDSRKLAHFLAKGMLKRVWVPTEKERYHRQVIRRRRQLIGDRIRSQSRIKAELQLHGIDLSAPHGKWTKIYLGNLGRIRFNNRFMQESFKRLLEQYYFLDEQINKQTDLLKKLSETERYKERVEILMTIPGIGMIAAMELLLELQDLRRFQRADQLAAYVGLTPSQYSSADKIRMGRITCVGKNSLRAMLIQASWALIRKDGVMREKYDKLKSRSGGKRAIVAVARILLIRMRRILLDNNPYVVGLVAAN